MLVMVAMVVRRLDVTSTKATQIRALNAAQRSMAIFKQCFIQETIVRIASPILLTLPPAACSITDRQRAIADDVANCHEFKGHLIA